MNATTLAALLCSGMILLGCGDDKAEDLKPAHDPALEACEALTDTPKDLTAGADRASAPVLPPEQPTLVKLPAAQEAWLRLEGPADLLLFSREANVVTGLYEDAATTDVLPQGSPNDDCPNDIQEHFDLELETAGSWYVRLGPSALTEAWLFLAPAAGHAH